MLSLVPVRDMVRFSVDTAESWDRDPRKRQDMTRQRASKRPTAETDSGKPRAKAIPRSAARLQLQERGQLPQGRQEVRRPRSVRLPMPIGAVCLVFGIVSGPFAQDAFGYVDPGTGGAVFGSLLPLLGAFGLLLVAAGALAWARLRRVLAFGWRHRVWIVPCVLAVVVALAWMALR